MSVDNVGIGRILFEIRTEGHIGLSGAAKASGLDEKTYIEVENGQTSLCDADQISVVRSVVRAIVAAHAEKGERSGAARSRAEGVQFQEILEVVRTGVQISSREAAKASDISWDSYMNIERGETTVAHRTALIMVRAIIGASAKAEGERASKRFRLTAVEARRQCVEAVERTAAHWEKLAASYEDGTIGDPLALLEKLPVDQGQTLMMALHDFMHGLRREHAKHLRVRVEAAKTITKKLAALDGDQKKDGA